MNLIIGIGFCLYFAFLLSNGLNTLLAIHRDKAEIGDLKTQIERACWAGLQVFVTSLFLFKAVVVVIVLLL